MKESGVKVKLLVKEWSLNSGKLSSKIDYQNILDNIAVISEMLMKSLFFVNWVPCKSGNNLQGD